MSVYVVVAVAHTVVLGVVVWCGGVVPLSSSLSRFEQKTKESHIQIFREHLNM